MAPPVWSEHSVYTPMRFQGEWEFPQELDSARTKLSRRSVPVVWANCIARDAGLERTVAIKVLASQV